MYDYYVVLGGMKTLTVSVSTEVQNHVNMYATESHVIHIPYMLEGPGATEREIQEFKKRIYEVEKTYEDNFNTGCMLISYHLLSK